jgi:hypothetical protein
MITLGYGKYVVNATSLDEGLELVRSMEVLDSVAQQRSKLRSIHHGHEFAPHTRQCECGMTDLEYMMAKYKTGDIPVCSVALSKIR